MWKVAADYSETPPTSETLAIRFANSDSKSGHLSVGSLLRRFCRREGVQEDV